MKIRNFYVEELNNMGLINSIVTKEDLKCPECNNSLRWSDKELIDFQSKECSDRMNCWSVGEKITLNSGCNLNFVAEGDDIWEGFAICPKCRSGIVGDIIIKHGVIEEIKNLKTEFKGNRCVI